MGIKITKSFDDIRISDDKPDYGEEAGEEMILLYTEKGLKKEDLC